MTATHPETRMTEQTPRPGVPPMPPRVQPTDSLVHTPRPMPTDQFFPVTTDEQLSLTQDIVARTNRIAVNAKAEATAERNAAFEVIAERFDAEAAGHKEKLEEAMAGDDMTMVKVNADRVQLARAKAQAIRDAIAAR